MKTLTYFYLENCPHCKKANQIMQQLCEQNPDFNKIDLVAIEENQNPDIVKDYDYFYVPCFFVENTKLHEGVLDKNIMENIFNTVLNG